MPHPNRRHLLPETYADNPSYSQDEKGELHPSEAVDERIALSERFGLWLSFYGFNQDAYLNIVAHWLAHFGCTKQEIAKASPEALRWALQRGGRSGRIAIQFARDYSGKLHDPNFKITNL